VQIFSLWCVSPKATGGLNFTTDNVGKILGISGANYAFLPCVFNNKSFTS
jgi:hypothetical protein